MSTSVALKRNSVPCGSPRASVAPSSSNASVTLAARHVVLLDGAEQMNAWAWWRFRRCVRHAGGLIITAHRSGLLPTVLNCGTSPRLLGEIVSRLLGDDRALSAGELERLYQRHSGNIREALRELYDVFGVLPHPTGVEADGSGRMVAVSFA